MLNSVLIINVIWLFIRFFNLFYFFLLKKFVLPFFYSPLCTISNINTKHYSMCTTKLTDPSGKSPEKFYENPASQRNLIRSDNNGKVGVYA